LWWWRVSDLKAPEFRDLQAQLEGRKTGLPWSACASTKRRRHSIRKRNSFPTVWCELFGSRFNEKPYFRAHRCRQAPRVSLERMRAVLLSSAALLLVAAVTSRRYHPPTRWVTMKWASVSPAAQQRLAPDSRATNAPAGTNTGCGLGGTPSLRPPKTGLSRLPSVAGGEKDR